MCVCVCVPPQAGGGGVCGACVCVCVCFCLSSGLSRTDTTNDTGDKAITLLKKVDKTGVQTLELLVSAHAHTHARTHAYLPAGHG